MDRKNLVAALLLALVAAPAVAQDHQHGTAGKLGEVHFTTTCLKPVTVCARSDKPGRPELKETREQLAKPLTAAATGAAGKPMLTPNPDGTFSIQKEPVIPAQVVAPLGAVSQKKPAASAPL